jgi:hypothetical protein
MSSIYLTGDVIESTDFSGWMEYPEPDWRTIALSKLQRYGMKVVNPIVGAWASDDGLERRVRRALDLIDQCDALLANLKTPSHGTPMEIFYAHQRGKMVTVVGQSPYSPWVLSHSKARFDDIGRALDFLIEEFPRPEILNWCLQYEHQMAERYEQFPAHGELDYQFLGGDSPVLVLAPHATAFFKEGEFQEPDMFTGCMAAGLHRESRCHALVSSHCSVADPLWHVETPMMRALADIVKSGQVGLVLVLLGSPWHESPGLIVESMGPKDSHEDYASRLRLRLSKLEPVGMVSSVGDGFSEPLLNFAAQVLNVPVLLVRTHRRYRMPRLQSEPFEQVLSLIGEFVNEVGTELQRSRG